MVSVPMLVPEYVHTVAPKLSVRDVCVWLAFGPAVIVKVTDTPWTGTPRWSSMVVVTVAEDPSGTLAVVVDVAMVGSCTCDPPSIIVVGPSPARACNGAK